METTDDFRPRNTRHSREDVARAALRILDEVGLPDLTMRRLAAALDVQPGALYWHYPNKQTLLAELADRIVSRARPAPDEDGPWEQRTRLEAARLRDALLAYRDGAEVVTSTLALGLGSADIVGWFAAPITAGGFDRDTASRVATVLLHFILGHVSQEQQRLQYDSLGVVVEGAVPADAGVDAGQVDSYEFGVELLIRGLISLVPMPDGRHEN
jgi:TetR/AcrR family tetracycline transcriptional repressor